MDNLDTAIAIGNEMIRNTNTNTNNNTINSDNTINSNYNFYFKLVHTNRTKNYCINPDFTINEFIEDVRRRIRRDFDFNDNDIIDIVEAGQFNNTNGRYAELAPVVEKSDTVLVKDNFHKNTSFYIRKEAIDSVDSDNDD